MCVISHSFKIVRLAKQQLNYTTMTTAAFQDVNDTDFGSKNNKSLHASPQAMFHSKIIEWNNAGSFSMKRGNYLAATRKLEMAMQRFKRVYPFVRKQGALSEPSSPLNRCDLDRLFSWSFCCTNEEQASSDTARVYNTPITLPPDFPLTMATCGFVSMTICLNLAMVHHLCGQELLGEYQEEPSSVAMRHFVTSSHYYDFTIRLARAQSSLAAQEERNISSAGTNAVLSTDDTAVTATSSTHQELQQQQQQQQQEQQPLLSPFLLMVCLNNMGHLHRYHLQNQQRSHECYLQLQKALLSLLIAWGGFSSDSDDGTGQTQELLSSATSSSAVVVANVAADATSTNSNMLILDREDLNMFLQNVAVGLALVKLGHTAAAA
jgi:hypothetical protein